MYWATARHAASMDAIVKWTRPRTSRCCVDPQTGYGGLHTVIERMAWAGDGFLGAAAGLVALALPGLARGA
jgi:hypothetical protein